MDMRTAGKAGGSKPNSSRAQVGRRPAHAASGLAQTVDTLYALAKSDDWTQREDAGFTLRNLIEQNFDEGMSLTRAWPTDASNFVRRTACLACMQRKASTDASRVRQVLERLSILMADDDLYVRKCCGPFVVGYMGYTYPSITLPWLRTMGKGQDLNVRANVAKAFSQALGKHHGEVGLEILDALASDTRHRVRSAVGSSLRHIVKHLGIEASAHLKRYPELATMVHATEGRSR
jgi:3-methyladenine DNA glycosylase AlkC